MPVIHSGTFLIDAEDNLGVVLVGFARTHSQMQSGAVCTESDCYANPAASAGTITMPLVSGHATVVTSADGSFDIASAPAGFTPTTNLRAGMATKLDLDAADSLKIEVVGLVSQTFNGPLTQAIVIVTNLVIPDNRSWALLVTDLFKWTLTGTAFFSQFIPYVPNTQVPNPVICPGVSPWYTPALRLSGHYDIIWYWWVLPDTTECGERNTRTPQDSESHLILAGEQPPTPTGSFGAYERFDPDDPHAAPQPVITSVDPNHGRAGTAVVIWGDGFGDDANVQFDGVDADDIVVVSRYQIRCTAPAHANGYANIHVINVDGVSS